MKLISALEFLDIPSDLITALALQAEHLHNGRLALVGGAVRDALLSEIDPCIYPRSPDLDFVYEGDMNLFCTRLQTYFGPRRIQELRLHDRFGTANLRLDMVMIDLASARLETYPFPAENPLVVFSSLENDLSRRDFTVNAMALVLNADGDSHLLDPYGGRQHLIARELVFLHDESVAEDPSRVIRGARYAARLGFTLGVQSILQVKSTLQLWPWSWRIGDPVDLVPPALGTRLRMELELLFDNEPWPQALSSLRSWSALSLLDQNLQNDSLLYPRLRCANRLQIPLLCALISGAADPVALSQRLQIPGQQQSWLEELLLFRRWLESDVLTTSWVEWGALKWTCSLEQQSWTPEVVALAICEHQICWRPLLRWWGRWRHASAQITASELMKQGFQPGPRLGEALHKSRLQALERMR
ncbi:CCA tRNA nucleotidyltransferase [Synechococcus sp. MIT S9508]|uniref:CCA tRNA nucleotidyltransferase n=1 Tax=Synechococcus sp. MIT S9508 TaxID=1801629 RepID=UPI0007BC0B54|nr:CCA tRNA nucleotidyltransferase [Synechococcus sp. MIT S9508]KZR90634.1 Multifunctional CCA protein [Synechococcus sp. MIT S9508]